MTVTLTRERLEWLSEISCRDDFEDIDGDEIREMARSVLASLDAEPVCWTDEQELRDAEKDGSGYLFTVNPVTPHADPRRVILLYRHAQLVPERDQIRADHAEWSQSTFGNVGPIGPLKHLSKEALEAAVEPGDLSEWADIQFLLWDAQRRAGITDEQITRAMVEKLAVNKQREWPAPKDGEPRLHIKEQPAPVVPEEVMPGGLAYSSALPVFEGNDRDKIIGYRCFISGDTRIVESQEQAYADCKAVVNACRAVMLQGKTSAVEPEEFLICDLCGHDAWHQGDRTYECTEGHVFEVRAPKSGEVPCGGVLWLK